MQSQGHNPLNPSNFGLKTISVTANIIIVVYLINLLGEKFNWIDNKIETSSITNHFIKK